MAKLKIPNAGGVTKKRAKKPDPHAVSINGVADSDRETIQVKKAMTKAAEREPHRPVMSSTSRWRQAIDFFGQFISRTLYLL